MILCFTSHVSHGFANLYFTYSLFRRIGKEYQMKFFATAVMLLSVAAANASAHKLPLDHGPRATSTPWVNQHIRDREATHAGAKR
jgi:hypothetical protein